MTLQRIMVSLCITFFMISASAKALRDPTQPPHIKAKAALPQAGSMRIGSIIIGPQRKMAQVNGQFVVVGDQVDGAVVSAIFPDKVVFKNRVETFEVSLSPQVLKKK